MPIAKPAIFSRILIFCFVFTALSANAANEFTVQTFNTYGPAYAPNLSTRTQYLLDELKTETCCDVVQFQEVWKENQFKALNLGFSSRGFSGVHFDDSRADGKITGLATFISGDILSQSSLLYPVNNQPGVDDVRESMGIEKGIGFVQAKLSGTGQNLLVLNSHTHPEMEPVRVAQTIYLIQQFFQYLPLRIPALLTADYNATPASPEYQLLRDVLRFRDALGEFSQGYTAGNICTYCQANALHLGSEGDRVIDYIFVRNSDSQQIDIATAQVLPTAWKNHTLSDHYGVRAHLSVSNSATPGLRLALDSNELAARFEAAKIALARAKTEMEQEAKAEYSDSLEYIASLEKDLADPSSTIFDYFRMP